MLVRGMDFAGAWYPADAEACGHMIERWWKQPLPESSAGARFGVVPHAGWVYSGSLAAQVFHALRDGAGAARVDVVIVLGGHLRPGDPVVAMSEGAWRTPFGDVPIHTGFNLELAALEAEGVPVLRETPQRYRADNSTEMQLPFVGRAFPQSELIVLRVPPDSSALCIGTRLADYLERSGLRAVGVASTDLTHYGPTYGFEPHGRGATALQWVRERNDAAFIEAIVAGDGSRMMSMAAERHNACSSGAVAALSVVAGRGGERFSPLGYATSDDVEPGASANFVGYVGGIWQ